MTQAHQIAEIKFKKSPLETVKTYFDFFLKGDIESILYGV